MDRLIDGPLPLEPAPIVLTWHRFSDFRSACAIFGARSCVYALTDDARNVEYVGKASLGLSRRYSHARGLLDALMRKSSAVLCAAEVERMLCRDVERRLIYWEMPVFNVAGKKTAPAVDIRVIHRGDKPAWSPRGEVRDEITGRPR